MNTVLRAGAVYGVLLVIFRLTGKRSLAQITPFDFILLLILSETTQQAMIGNDFSFTGALIAILTLVMLDLGLSLLKARWRFLDRWVDSVPLIIVDDGKPLVERMERARVDLSDVLAAARSTQGIASMDQIKYAVLERNGLISIIPRDDK